MLAKLCYRAYFQGMIGSMLFHSRVLHVALLSGCLGLTWTSAAQGSRTGVIAPPDLWIRADFERDWGQPRVLTTCSEEATLTMTTETLPADPDGAYTVVRSFRAVCGCSGRVETDRQFIRVLPAVTLPSALPASGCAPTWQATPGETSVTLGEPRVQTTEAMDPSTGAPVRVQETSYLLWRDACGLGSEWVVWEAWGECGASTRQAFLLHTVAPALNGPSPSMAISESAIPMSDFDAEAWGIGPLDAPWGGWQGLRAVEVYRNWASGTSPADGGRFEQVAIGCGSSAVVGTETVQVIGNHPPRLRFEPEVDIACGLPQSEWPEVRARDRPLPGFGTTSDWLTLPVEEQVDTLVGECPGRLVIQRHLRAVDADGAEAVAVQTLHIHDDEPPVFFNSPSELVVPASDWPPLDATAFAQDGCTDDVTLVWADSTDCVSGRIHRISTASDGCGNVATLRQVLIPSQAVETPAAILAVGCTDPSALNYTGEACFLTAHCLYAGEPDCVGDLDENGTVSTGDLLMLLGIFGTLCAAP